MPNRVENAREENVSFLMEMDGKLWPGVWGKARGLEHRAPITVGSTLQTLSAVAVICCEVSQLVHGEEETG